jgi:hypothetical protein
MPLAGSAECYCFKTPKGWLRIVQSQKNAPLWDLYLNHLLIRPDYRDPWQAAADASNSDFGDDDLDMLLRFVTVPADLERWRKEKGRF